MKRLIMRDAPSRGLSNNCPYFVGFEVSALGVAVSLASGSSCWPCWRSQVVCCPQYCLSCRRYSV